MEAKSSFWFFNFHIFIKIFMYISLFLIKINEGKCMNLIKINK